MFNHRGLTGVQSASYKTCVGFTVSSCPQASLQGEPLIADVMADAAIRQIMARDGVRADQLDTLLSQVRLRLL